MVKNALTRSRTENATTRTSIAGALLFLNFGARTIVNFLLLSMVLRYLGKQEAGAWIILQSVALYLGLSEMGLGQTVINFVGEAFTHGDQARINQVFTTAFGLYWLIVVPVWIIATLAGSILPVDGWLLHGASPELATLFRPAFLLMAAFTLLRIPLTVFPATLPGLRELPLRQLYELATTILTFAIVAVVLVAGGRLLTLIVAPSVVAGCLMLLVYPLLIRRRAGFIKLSLAYWKPALLRSLFTNSSFFFLIGVSFILDRSAGNLLVGRYGQLAQVPAMFALLTLFRVLCWSLINMISTALQPYIIMFNARGQHEQVIFFARLSSKVGVISGAIMVSAIWLFAQDIFRLWLGPGVFPGYIPLAILAGSFLLDSMFLSTSNFLIVLNRHRALALASAFKSLATVVFGILGAHLVSAQPFWGICGGLLAASILNGGFMLPAITRRGLQLSWRDYVMSFLVRPGLIIVALGLFASLTRPLQLDPAIVRMVVFAGIFGVILGLTWILVLTEDERRWLMRLVARLRRRRHSHQTGLIGHPTPAIVATISESAVTMTDGGMNLISGDLARERQ